MNTTIIIDNLQRIITEAIGLGAGKCPPAPHGCPACEILHLANESLKAMVPLAEHQIESLGEELDYEHSHTESQRAIVAEMSELMERVNTIIAADHEMLKSEASR